MGAPQTASLTVVLRAEEFVAMAADGRVVEVDLADAIASGRAWWVAWDGGLPLVCEGDSAEDVLESLAGLAHGDEALEHEGGAAAWARARGWVARQLVGVVG